MNQEKSPRSKRMPTSERRKDASLVLLNSGIYIPEGSMIIKNPTEIIKDKLNTTTASLIRPGYGNTPGVHSFGQMIKEYGPAGWDYLGIGVVMVPTESKLSSEVDEPISRVEQIEKAAEKLTRNETALLIGKLATIISDKE